MPLSGGITGRSAFAEPQRVSRATAPRRKQVPFENAAARSSGGVFAAQKRFDERDDVVAVGDEPARERVDETGDRDCAGDGGRHSQDRRAAEGVVQLFDRHAI